jgi:hypothetical protein
MATKPLQATSMNNPQQIFESALTVMHQGRRRNGAPIAARTRPIAPIQSDQQIEKRALTDAARALAQLWNVSPHLVR